MIRLNPHLEGDMKIIHDVIKRSAPPTVKITKGLLENIENALFSGEMAAWIYEDGSPIGVSITAIRDDVLLGKRELLLYAVSNLREIRLDEWDKCFLSTRDYALKNGCTHITAYTIVNKIIKMAERMNGNVDTRYISIPLGG
jgi:hypothetical protein